MKIRKIVSVRGVETTRMIALVTHAASVIPEIFVVRVLVVYTIATVVLMGFASIVKQWFMELVLNAELGLYVRLSVDFYNQTMYVSAAAIV